MAETRPHFLLITYPAQGHINPALHFATQLLRLGVKLTFAATVSTHRRITKSSHVSPPFNFVLYSDGYDDGFDSTSDDHTLFMSQFRTTGTQSLKEIILSNAETGTPVTCLVYTLLLPWAAEVARDHNVTPALLWIQPASVFRVYYYYFKGYDDTDNLIAENCNEPSWSIQLPGLPSLRTRDLPSLCLPSNPYDVVLSLLKGLLQMLDSFTKPNILVNTFDALEEEALKEIDGKMNMIGVGPLVPSAFLDGKHLQFETSQADYLEWMTTKPEGSIVYISFGSMVVLSKKQKDAMARGLIESGRPFLWVIREKTDDDGEDETYMEKLKLDHLGLMVPWCSQLEVLSHPSLGCFVTHCGWNSTLESMVCGVPVVAFPHWSDQSTNAKLIEDVWGTGVRMGGKEVGVVDMEEMKKCIEMVMGGHERGERMRKNAKKWKDLAREAMKETGSSYMNLKKFVDESSMQENVLLVPSKEESESN